MTIKAKKHTRRFFFAVFQGIFLIKHFSTQHPEQQACYRSSPCVTCQSGRSLLASVQWACDMARRQLLSQGQGHLSSLLGTFCLKCTRPGLYQLWRKSISIFARYGRNCRKGKKGVQAWPWGWKQDRTRMRLISHTLLTSMWLIQLPSRLVPRKFPECFAKGRTLELSIQQWLPRTSNNPSCSSLSFGVCFLSGPLSSVPTLRKLKLDRHPDFLKAVSIHCLPSTS